MDYRRQVQVVFQDPYSSLSPRMRVGEIIGEPIEAHERLSRREVRDARRGALAAGRPPARHGPALSARVQRRAAPAPGHRPRAVHHARLIVLDEPVSALDVSIRAHIISLLEELQARLGVSYLFIAHDLAAVSRTSASRSPSCTWASSSRSPTASSCAPSPLHPYTKALFAASLPSHPDEPREEIVLSGEVPSALNPPSGCHFHPRCPFAMPRCSEDEPKLMAAAPGHRVACHLY